MPNAGLWLARPRRYRMHGLQVESACALEGWPEAPAGHEPDVLIARRPVEWPRTAGAPHTTFGRLEEDGITLAVRGVAAYRAIGGREIVVDPEPGVATPDLLLYLTGVMFGLTLHLRGAWPLHAGVVDLGGARGAIAFAGPSGVGKSTLVTALVQGGGRLVTDDVAVCHQTADGVQVSPGAGRAKLDPASLDTLALGDRAAGLEPAGGDRGKLHLPVDVTADTPVPLRRVYLLDDGAHLGLEPLTGIDAVSALLEQTYLLAHASALGLAPQCFRHAAALASAVPIARLVRPRGFAHLPATLDLLIRDAADPGGRKVSDA